MGKARPIANAWTRRTTALCVTLLAGTPGALAQGAGGADLGAGQVLQTLLGLAVVLAFIGVAAWLARRGFGLRPGPTGRLRVIAGVALGSRERAVLVAVGSRQLLVGVAPGRVQTLMVLDPDEIEEVPAAPESFSTRLLQATRRAGSSEVTTR